MVCGFLFDVFAANYRKITFRYSAHYIVCNIFYTLKKSNEVGKDQESINSSTTPDQGHLNGNLQKHKKTSHTRKVRNRT